MVDKKALVKTVLIPPLVVGVGLGVLRGFGWLGQYLGINGGYLILAVAIWVLVSILWYDSFKRK